MPKTSLIVDETTALRQKKKARIIALCLLSFVFVVVVLVVVFACIKTYLKPNFIQDPDRIIIYNQNATYGQFSKDADVEDSRYDKFMKLFNESFSTNYLVALFNGSLGGYNIDKNSERTKLSTIQTELQSGFYVQFVYSDSQTLTYSNGDVYNSIYASATPIEYTSLYFALSDTDDLSTIDIYVSYKSNNDSYVVKVSQKANTFGLYENRLQFKS